MKTKHVEHLKMPNARRLLSLMEAPLQRLIETPWWGRVVAPIGAVLSFIWKDWFTPLVLLLAISHVFDYYFGTRAAKATDEYDPRLAEFGLHSKMAGIFLCVLIRGAEWWATTRVPTVDTGGALAVAFALSLLAKDLETISFHRERMGAGPIPILGAILAWLRHVTNVLLPPGITDDPQERERNMHEEEEP